MSTGAKAKELIEKFKPSTIIFEPQKGWMDDLFNAKACAVILCDEMVSLFLKWQPSKTSIEIETKCWEQITFWQEVKTILLTPDKTQ